MDGGGRLPGGNDAGAVRVGDTVRRRTGPWTSAVHALLDHVNGVGFHAAPRALGIDEYRREVLSLLPGDTVGDRIPWPAWVHSDAALTQVAQWLADYHAAVASFVPPPEAVWREGDSWRPGLIIGHNDAAPYNAAWQHGRLIGFFDWDLAGPTTPDDDLALTAFSWVPLHTRVVVQREGFTAFDQRLRRLNMFLAAYGSPHVAEEFVRTVQARVTAIADRIAIVAERGDPAYQQMIIEGKPALLRRAVIELDALLGDVSGAD